MSAGTSKNELHDAKSNGQSLPPSACRSTHVYEGYEVVIWVEKSETTLVSAPGGVCTRLPRAGTTLVEHLF
jgi:hypothetical protein